MAPYYKIVTSHSALTLDQTLLDTMEQQNKDELQKIEDRLAEAEKQEGESEISDALRAKATYLTRIGDKVGQSAHADLQRTDVCASRIGLSKPRHLRWRKLRVSVHGLTSS